MSRSWVRYMWMSFAFTIKKVRNLILGRSQGKLVHLRYKVSLQVVQF